MLLASLSLTIIKLRPTTCKKKRKLRPVVRARIQPKRRGARLRTVVSSATLQGQSSGSLASTTIQWLDKVGLLAPVGKEIAAETRSRRAATAEVQAAAEVGFARRRRKNGGRQKHISCCVRMFPRRCLESSPFISRSDDRAFHDAKHINTRAATRVRQPACCCCWFAAYPSKRPSSRLARLCVRSRALRSALFERPCYPASCDVCRSLRAR